MAYTFEQSYYFRPYRGNSSFWLNRYGNGSIASHQKATLYTAAGSADQRLKVHKVSGGCQLLSDLNNAYGLNIYGRGAGSVCDFYPVSGNESDALIDLLTVDATNNLYRIKMINHNLYLTPASNSSGAALTWENPIKIVRGRNGGLSLPDGYHLFKKMYMTPVQALALHRALLYVPDEIKKILETILTDFAW